jgi:hypothetical protein
MGLHDLSSVILNQYAPTTGLTNRSVDGVSPQNALGQGYVDNKNDPMALYSTSTSGSVGLQPIVFQAPDGNFVLIRLNPTQISEEPLTVSAKIGEIQHQLSLNIKQLSEILRVSRPTVYAWLENTTPQDNHKHRLEVLHEVAMLWQERSPEYPVGIYLTAKAPGCNTLLDILRQACTSHEVAPMLDILVPLVSKRAKFNQRLSKVSKKGSVTETETLYIGFPEDV